MIEAIQDGGNYQACGALASHMAIMMFSYTCKNLLPICQRVRRCWRRIEAMSCLLPHLMSVLYVALLNLIAYFHFSSGRPMFSVDE